MQGCANQASSASSRVPLEETNALGSDASALRGISIGGRSLVLKKRPVFKAGLLERARQIELAEERGEKHLGMQQAGLVTREA